MPDYIYLLKNRLNIHQRNALEHIRLAAREEGMTVFLVGGAVRDLTSGSPVFDLDVTVQGNALNLKKPLENAGGKCWGEHEPSRTLFFRFPVGVTVEISSARREEYPKPGKPVYQWDTILEDLRRRDFTANAMALSLNEHSYGLLMDPLNGVADIEARQLRLVSNYGFIEDPSRLLRATRLVARLGWELDERTRTRYQNAKEENSIEALSSYQKGYELEEIGHEEDGLRVLTAMETEGWMQHLFPAWTTASADPTALEEMRKLVTQLQMQGVSPDISAPSIQYLTAKMPAKDLAALKAMFVRPGFVEEWNNLDHGAREFNKLLMGKEASTASASWKLFTSADPQAVLWLGLTSKSPAVKEKYKNFFTVWPEARQKIPHALLQELRITPELPGYDEMIGRLFLGVIDQELETEEQLRAFLEPYSPPAPPPPVTVRRTRGSRKGADKKAPVEVAFDGDADADPEVEADADADVDALDLDDEEVAEDVGEEIEDEDDSEVSLPPVVKKSTPAPKKSLSEGPSSQNGKPAPKEETPSAVPVAAKAPVTPSLHVVAPAKPTKVHVMAKPGTPAPSASTAAPKKPLPMKSPGGKAVPAKPVAAKQVASKPVASKAPSRPVVKPAVKAFAKNGAHAKTVAAKAPAKLHKKPEPVKKSHPAKKPAPAKKHK
jgi:tRNA nucleotidyltransferase (CCA-adding enzyme)